MSARVRRVAELMKRELASLIPRKLRDPRLQGMVSITDVELTNDLSFARVFVSVLETGESRERVLEALAHAAGFVRSALAPRLGLREVPEIRFVLDDSIERGSRVDDLLRRLERGENPAADEQ